MKCPQCNEQMNRSQVEDITIHDCLSCRGMWFARGNLEEVKDELLPDLGWLDIDEWKSQLEFSVRHQPLNCPHCGQVALTTVQDPRSAVEISMCTQCGGTWLDTGQFLQLVNALDEEAARKPAPQVVRHLLEQTRDLLSKPDALPSQWNDLKSVLRLLYHRIFVEHPKLKSVLVGIQESLPI